jgi:hypothetical protein
MNLGYFSLPMASQKSVTERRTVTKMRSGRKWEAAIQIVNLFEGFIDILKLPRIGGYNIILF